MERMLNQIMARTRLEMACAGAGSGSIFCALFFVASGHYRDLLMSGEHLGLILFYFLTVTLFGASMGDTARRNAEWLKTLTDWKNRDTVRPFTLAPYPQKRELEIVIGEKHDDRGPKGHRSELVFARGQRRLHGH